MALKRDNVVNYERALAEPLRFNREPVEIVRLRVERECCAALVMVPRALRLPRKLMRPPDSVA